MRPLYRARLETRHFEFEALGTTRAHARNTLRSGLRKHERQYGMRLGAMTPFESDIDVTPLDIGVCYRDREAVQ